MLKCGKSNTENLNRVRPIINARAIMFEAQFSNNIQQPRLVHKVNSDVCVNY